MEVGTAITTEAGAVEVEAEAIEPFRVDEAVVVANVWSVVLFARRDSGVFFQGSGAWLDSLGL